MIVLTKVDEAHQWVIARRDQGLSIGFVPTMGALHQGHISLVERAADENDIVVVSIFVNPIQFNNKEDLLKYPRDLEKDLLRLSGKGCTMVFSPSTEEMYPEEVKEQYDFGPLEKVMEGAFREGHFNGVAVVVKRLFEILLPDRAYFGEKDFQQLRIIQRLTEITKLPVEIIPCAIYREDDGLAMSSRNQRLDPEERKRAPIIYKTLSYIKAHKEEKLSDLLERASHQLNAVEGMRLEYLLIADLETLQPIDHLREDGPAAGIFVAVYLGQIRLIDNMFLNS